MSAMLKSECLENLHHKVANDAYALYEALAVCVAEETQETTLPTAIAQVVAYVEDIGTSAAQAKLVGLQQVCTLTQDHLLELQNATDSAYRKTLCSEVERFPRLVSNYLHAPTDDNSRQKLITHLQSVHWQSPLTAEKANELSHLLIINGQEEHPTETPIVTELPVVEPTKESVLMETVNSSAETATEPSDSVKEQMLIEEVSTAESELSAEVVDLPVIEELNNTSDFLKEVILVEAVSNTAPELPDAILSAEVEELKETGDSVLSDEAFDELIDEISDIPRAEISEVVHEITPIDLPIVQAEIRVVSDAELDRLIDEAAFDTLPTSDPALEVALLVDEELPELIGDEPVSMDDDSEDIKVEELPDVPLEMMADTNSLLLEIVEHNLTINEPVDTLQHAQNLVESTSPPTHSPVSAYEMQRSEALAHLSDKIVDMGDTLAIALNKFVTASEDSEIFLEGIEQYTNSVQSFWEMAEKIKLIGLQTVCTFINDNLFALSAQPQPERFALHEQFALWPKLVLDYLHNPAKGATILVEHLHNPRWSLPLSEAHANALLVQLMQETVVLQIETPHAPPRPKTPSKPPVAESPPVVVESSPKKVVLPIVKETTTVLPVSQVPSVVESFKKEGLPVLETREDVVLELSVSMPDWGDAFIEEGVQLASEKNEATQAEADLGQLDKLSAESPPTLTDSMTEDMVAAEIPTGVETIAMPILEEESAIIKEESDFTEETVSPEEQIESTIIQHVEDFQLAEPDVIDLLQAEISEALGDLNKALNKFGTAKNASTELSESVEQYIDNVQSIADTAEMAGLLGVEEVCQFIKDNLFELSTQGLAIRRAAQPHIHIWTTLVSNYLQQPLTGAQNLVAYLSASNWHFALDETAAQKLLNRLTNGVLGSISTETTPFLEPVEGHPEPTIDTLDSQPVEIAPTVDNLDNLEIQLSKDEPVEKIAEVTELIVEDTIEPIVETTDQPETAEVVLANPDVIELISGQVNDLIESLTETWQKIVIAEDGSEELLTEVGNYTEIVQSIWDAADMASLSGLQAVCTFINDNMMGLGGQDKATRQASQEIVANWTPLVLIYLQTPSVGAAELVRLMQDAHWSVPLTEEQANSLLQQLLTPKTETVDKTDSEPKFDRLITSVTEEQSLPTESLPDIAGESKTGEALYIAAPDIIELVYNQITDVAEGLSTALEVCVSMENDNPAFLEAIETYTNHVQSIWDAAEMAGLTGLQEVCTFINDNLMAFSAQDQASKLATQRYFRQFPALVLEYLNTPLPGAQNLVALLQESGWSSPLDVERAESVLALLTKPAEHVESNEESLTTEEEIAVDSEEVAEEDSAEEMTELEAEGGDQQISLGSAEALEILSSELESAKEELTVELQKFTTLANNAAGFAESGENYTDHLQRLNAAAEMLGLGGLQSVCTFVIENMKLLGTKDLATRAKAKGVLEKWPDLVLAYLKTPGDSVIPMLNHFREREWAQPLPDEQAHALLTLLTQGSTAEVEEEAAYSRQTQAKPEDVILTIPEDINRDLLDAYLQEVPQHASDFSAVLQKIIQQPESEDIKKAQRIAHTLKGSSNIIGIKGIANIAHHLEDILEYLFSNQVAPPKPLTDTMIEAADCLEIMVDSLLGQDDAPPQAQQVLQDVLDWANRIDKGNLEGAAPPKTRVAPSSAASTPEKTADKPTEDKADNKAKPVAAVATDAGSEQVLRVPTKTVDNLMRLVGELSISIGQVHERLKHVLNSTRVLTEQSLILQQKTFALENLVDVRGVTGVENRYREAAEDEEDFDPLEFEEYNELHSVAHSFIESIADSRELGMSIRNDLAELETIFIQQERLNKEFQASIMTTRMVPVNTIISKLQRNIRQTCRTTGKQAELEIIGADILIDSDVLNNLADPLMHILRNSVDHGLESVEERELVGKPASGTIKLHFYREGNNIVVSCKDDGQGLNYTNIRYTAIQRGIIKENQEMSEAELGRLILMSGFSTKSGVTQVSGRGVGMDVVHTNIRQMKGTLDLISETGKGMTLLIKLPMSLVTVHTLLVRVGNQRFGIPTSHLEQALAPGLGELQKIGNEISLKLGKNIYAIKVLAELLHIPGEHGEITQIDTRPIILVHEETGVIATVVDELLDSRDLVMKSMGKYVTKVHGVSGAAILGDGSLVPLLDLPELLRAPQAAMSNFAGDTAVSSVAAPARTAQIMIVDDSLSVRKSLSLLVEDAGFETLLAKDGLEAIELMNQHRPNVMLVDMEMPRMNGLELTAHVRANQATQHIPIFMITSRTTEKHREQAKAAGVNAYLTKPYQDTELLALIDKALK